MERNGAVLAAALHGMEVDAPMVPTFRHVVAGFTAGRRKSDIAGMQRVFPIANSDHAVVIVKVQRVRGRAINVGKVSIIEWKASGPKHLGQR